MQTSKFKKFIAIIPARGGSKGILRKNIKPLAGKPLIAYTIEVALESRYIERVIVSTEDKEIAGISRKYGAEVIIRPEELAKDETPSVPVFQHVIKYLEENDDCSLDVVVVLQPTAPLRIVDDIDCAIEKFLRCACDSVVSVCEVEHPLHWTFTLDKSGRMKPIFEGFREIKSRQDAPKAYRLNGAVYVVKKEIIMEQNTVFGDDIRAYAMPIKRSVDIDTEVNLKLTEVLINEEGENR